MPGHATTCKRAHPPWTPRAPMALSCATIQACTACESRYDGRCTSSRWWPFWTKRLHVRREAPPPPRDAARGKHDLDRRGTGGLRKRRRRGRSGSCAQGRRRELERRHQREETSPRSALFISPTCASTASCSTTRRTARKMRAALAKDPSFHQDVEKIRVERSEPTKAKLSFSKNDGKSVALGVSDPWSPTKGAGRSTTRSDVVTDANLKCVKQRGQAHAHGPRSTRVLSCGTTRRHRPPCSS